jgi:Leucine-rich repeat (LRR) protein
MATKLPPHQIVSVADLEKKYEPSAVLHYPYAQFAKRQQQRLYPGGLHVDGDFSSEPKVDANPYNVVVDGDLVVSGTIEWSDYGGSFVYVTGNVRCKNLLLQGCPSFVVRGDLVVENGIQGHHGDDGGYLDVRGATRAKLIVNTLYFNMTFGSPPEAIICSHAGRINCPIDFGDEEFGDVFLPEFLDDGGIEELDVSKALREGRDVLRSGAVGSHRVALAKIEAAIAAGDPVPELDLSDAKLRGFPVRVLDVPGLRRLILDKNPHLGEVPDAIARLDGLEELGVASCGLSELPEALARLDRLERLDVTGNEFDALPEVVARIPNLKVLHAERLAADIPDALGDAPALEELDLSFLRSATGKLTPFPRCILRLKRLRRLDLSTAALEDVPDDIARMTSLEELNLDTALGRVTRLPPLHELPALRVLRISGGAGNTGMYAPHALLDGVWSIGTLEVLAIDRYGEQKQRRAVVRGPLTALPDDAFARMPNLKVVDLSFNDLVTLPESFYALTKLTRVDLRYTKLDRATLERLATTFPAVKLDLRNVKTRFDVDDPNWQAVHARVERAAKLASRDREAALVEFEAALARCTATSCFAPYDELYALYGATEALSHLRLRAQGAERDAMTEKIVRYASLALERVPLPGSVWHFTDEGAFHEEVTRRTGNALAWTLMERGDLERALAVVDRALAVGGERGYVFDTKVRILLRAGREDEAYRIVDEILTGDPSFKSFQDLAASKAFEVWRSANR